MKLHHKEINPNQHTGTPIIVMHGMFGSMSNLGVVSRPLSEHFRVISVDLRNHGQSPHDSAMSYPSMAADIIELMDNLGIERAHLLGHSMGGKVAMQVAMNFPERSGKVIVGDIAPVTLSARAPEVPGRSRHVAKPRENVLPRRQVRRFHRSHARGASY